MSNHSLFFYGQLALLKQLGGCVVLTIGLFLFLVSWILALIVMAIGIWLIFTGKADRFDYQRQSGNIVHFGDR
jgi:ABC-type bacteriocin/lantibiotic exporter with double-glycine peptidase domain